MPELERNYGILWVIIHDPVYRCFLWICCELHSGINAQSVLELPEIGPHTFRRILICLIRFQEWAHHIQLKP
jgi:hypothetical protein